MTDAKLFANCGQLSDILFSFLYKCTPTRQQPTNAKQCFYPSQFYTTFVASCQKQTQTRSSVDKRRSPIVHAKLYFALIARKSREKACHIILYPTFPYLTQNPMRHSDFLNFYAKVRNRAIFKTLFPTITSLVLSELNIYTSYYSFTNLLPSKIQN